MNSELKKSLDIVKAALETAKKYEHAVHVMNFDMETICPPEAIEEEGRTIAFLETEGYKLIKSDAFIRAAEYCYEHRTECPDEWDRKLAEILHREYEKIRNITPEQNYEFSLAFNKAYADWLKAKNAADYALFSDSLSKVRDVDLKIISLREEEKRSAYDHLLDDYERGMTTADLDEAFGICKERLIPMMEKIRKSKKAIRYDFMVRPVTDEQQQKFARFLLETIGYDFNRGAFTTTEHPFTDDLDRNDVRVTTHYYPDNFTSSMYSIIHEGGHAIFGQNQPGIHHDHFLSNRMTLGMHESVSRFYENRIGRSREFIDLVFEPAKRFFPGLLDDVSREEFYEAVNRVCPSFIRTEADEFTYTFHIIIRYEMEKLIINEGASIGTLPELWNDRYERYLGIRPRNDKEGILQDVHWSSGFGYFPTYALGNMYNAMYFNRMKKEIDPLRCVAEGNITAVNAWMTENVFKKASVQDPKEWIMGITGRSFTPTDFLDYLEEKYGEIYDL